jgi:hypothetical protein
MEIKLFNKSFNIIHRLIALGIWIIVLQNAGVIETKKEVKVLNTVDVQGNVDVEGSVNANVENTVDINVRAINGDENAFFDHGYDGNYNRLPVYTGN